MNSFHLPGIHERGVPGVPPLLRHWIHRWCTHLLPEPSRPSPPLYAGPSEFHRATVQFLGYIIGQEGIQMYQGKVTAITEWPIPQSVKELQRFLGFAHFYRRFIKDFSLHTLMSMLWGKPKSLSWNTNAHEAFKKLKTAFSTAPNPSPSRPQCPICGGRGRLHRRSYAVLAIRWASTAPALRILL